MDRAAYVAMTGAKQILVAQGLSGHNIANTITPGFRADLYAFASSPIYGPGQASRVNAVVQEAGWDASGGAIESTIEERVVQPRDRAEPLGALPVGHQYRTASSGQPAQVTPMPAPDRLGAHDDPRAAERTRQRVDVPDARCTDDDGVRAGSAGDVQTEWCHRVGAAAGGRSVRVG